MTKRNADAPRQFKRTMPKGYEYDLDRIVDEIFNTAYKRDWTWSDLAKFSGLCYQTVWLIGERRTRFPQWMTLFKMAKAVQLHLTFQEKRPSTIKDARRRSGLKIEV